MTGADVEERFHSAFQDATRCLKGLTVFCGQDPAFGGLSGWVFEKTIQKCIRESLASRRDALPIDEQFSLGGRVKADLKVGTVVVEIRSAGLFGQADIDKYRTCKSAARSLGLRFVFLSLYESHQPFRAGVTDALGAENVFFLREDAGSWQRFIDLLLSEAVAK